MVYKAIQGSQEVYLETETEFQLKPDWNPVFYALYHINQWELDDGAIDNIIELGEHYNYVNMGSGWLGLLSEI
jgi:hypothetical protein